MLLYRGHRYRRVAAYAPGEAIARALTNFLYGQGYETEGIETPAGEYITENELTTEEREAAADRLAQPETMLSKLVEYYGSLDYAAEQFAQATPELVGLTGAELESALPALAPVVREQLLEELNALAYTPAPWRSGNQ
jgi:hypothetical protein